MLGDLGQVAAVVSDGWRDQSHPLYVLAEALDWEFFEREFVALYVEQKGRPGLPMRLPVGPHYLKRLYDVSAERVVADFNSVLSRL